MNLIEIINDMKRQQDIGGMRQRQMEEKKIVK